MTSLQLPVFLNLLADSKLTLGALRPEPTRGMGSTRRVTSFAQAIMQWMLTLVGAARGTHDD